MADLGRILVGLLHAARRNKVSTAAKYGKLSQICAIVTTQYCRRRQDQPVNRMIDTS
jgi:hypothetical protein